MNEKFAKKIVKMKKKMNATCFSELSVAIFPLRT